MDKQQIANDLKTVFEGTPWYGHSVIKILTEISVQNINNSFKNGNSIAQIVEHMLAWRVFSVEMLKGNISYKIELNTTQDWEKGKLYTFEDWEKLIEKLKQNQAILIEQIEHKTDTTLAQNIPQKTYSYFQVLTNCIQHDIYHLGQVALLNK